MVRFLGLILACVMLAYASPSRAVYTPEVAWQKCLEAVSGPPQESDPGREKWCELNSAKSRVDAWMSYGYTDYVYVFRHFPFSGSVSCSSGSEVNTLIDGEYAGTGNAPLYSTPPGSFCECLFYPVMSWHSPAKTNGRCVLTGNVFNAHDPPSDHPVEKTLAVDPNNCASSSTETFCYKPDPNELCVMSEGVEYCLPGPQLDHGSADAGKTPKNCGIFNGVYLCVGSPSAPTPNVDPTPPLKSSDTVTTSDGHGGPSRTTAVDVYDSRHLGNNENPGDGSTHTGSTGNMGNNGSEGKAKSDGTCADGKTPSAGGCGAGYADRGCDAPPTCSGDPLLCSGIKEQHASRCADKKMRDGLLDSDAAKAALDALGLAAPGVVNLGEQIYDQTIGDGSGGGKGLDTTGWGYDRRCPLVPKTFSLMGQSVTIDFSIACTPLNLGGILVMIMAYLAAARILFIQ